MTRIDIPADIDAVFRTVIGEARGQCFRDQLAVAYAIRERALSSGWWGHGYAGVAMNPSQFSCWRSDDPNRKHCLDPFDLPERVWQKCLSASMAAVCGDDADAPMRAIRGGADMIPAHYVDRSIPLPDWATAEGVIEVHPGWESAFRWFVNVPGDPKRTKS